MTEEHRIELDYLVKEWVEITQKSRSKKDHIPFGRAYSLLFQYGLDGKVNAMDQIEDSEFNQAKDYLKQKIAIARNKVPKEKDCNSEYRNIQYAKIHALCKSLSISDETRKEYQLKRFGKESLKDFTDDELLEMAN